MREISRRAVLQSMGATMIPLAGCTARSEGDSNTTIEVEIHQTDLLERFGRDYGAGPHHALDATENAVRVCLRDLSQRVDHLDYVVRSSEEPVEVLSTYRASKTLDFWEDHERVTESDADAIILLAVGRGADPPALARDRISVNMTAPDALNIPRDEVSVSNEPRGNHNDEFDAYRSLQLTVHEMGHNLGLQHEHAAVTRDDIVTISPMAMEYYLEIGGKENACGHVNAEIATREPEGETTEFLDEEVQFRHYGRDEFVAEPVNLSLAYSECAVSHLAGSL